MLDCPCFLSYRLHSITWWQTQNGAGNQPHQTKSISVFALLFHEGLRFWCLECRESWDPSTSQSPPLKVDRTLDQSRMVEMWLWNMTGTTSMVLHAGFWWGRQLRQPSWLPRLGLWYKCVQVNFEALNGWVTSNTLITWRSKCPTTKDTKFCWVCRNGVLAKTLKIHQRQPIDPLSILWTKWSVGMMFGLNALNAWNPCWLQNPVHNCFSKKLATQFGSHTWKDLVLGEKDSVGLKDNDPNRTQKKLKQHFFATMI